MVPVGVTRVFHVLLASVHQNQQALKLALPAAECKRHAMIQASLSRCASQLRRKHLLNKHQPGLGALQTSWCSPCVKITCVSCHALLMDTCIQVAQ